MKVSAEHIFGDVFLVDNFILTGRSKHIICGHKAQFEWIVSRSEVHLRSVYDFIEMFWM